MTRRKARILETKPAGKGEDGHLYGVSSVLVNNDASSRAARPKPCTSCPWRKDAPVGAFPAEAFRISAHTCYDGAMDAFSCHESGAEKPALCAGFLLANSANNNGVRIGLATRRLSFDKIGNPDDVPLYESYREMAIANGVDPMDPAIAPCRGDEECFEAVHQRVIKAQKQIKPDIR